MKELKIFRIEKPSHDTQHNDIQHKYTQYNDAQHNVLINDIIKDVLTQ